MHKNLRLIYITTKDQNEARTIARTLVEEKLAACANILPKMESVYRWEGKVVEENECVLLVKTHYSNIKDLTSRVVELHTYDCPCVISLPLTEDEGHHEYLSWLMKESKRSGPIV